MSRNITLHVCTGDQVTPEMLSAAAKIFSENYGVWGDGKRVKMGPKSIKKMVLPEIQEAKNYYVRAMSGDVLAGNVFACRWVHDGRQVCWITQLVVKEDFRGEGIATSLLRKLREGHPDDRGFGLLSSHPAAVRAALRAFGRELESVDLEMTKEWAGKIMSSSPVEYVRTASLHGSLFEQQVTDGSVSCADTKFPVDHAEPLEALKKIRDQGMTWPFGELPDGHEFLILVKVKTDGMRRDGQKSSEF